MATKEVEGSGSGSSLPNYDYDKSRCIRFLDVKSRYKEKEWYLMDLSNMNKSKSHDNEEFRLFSKNELSKLSTIVGMGSCIFSIGGGTTRETPCRRVFCYDTASDNGWEKKASMCNGRAFPAVAVLNGKVYVMSDIFCNEHLKTSAESFDPATGTWSKLPKPPFPLFPYRLKCVTLEVAQKIVVISILHEILLYDVVSNNWEEFPQSVRFYGEFGGLGVAGKTIYWYRMGLHAYDFDAKQKFFGRIKGLSRHKDHLNLGDYVKSTSHVFHLSGNLFCLLWGCCDYVHCRTFQVTKCMDGMKGCLTASVVSYKSHKFDSKLLCFHDATLSDRKLGEEIAGGAYEVPTTVMASINEVKGYAFFSSSIPKYDYGKSVCILVKKYNHGSQWFMVDLSSRDDEEGSARPFWEENCENCEFSSAIAGVGSNLYCFAGELYSSCPKVLCYDSSYPHHGWKEGGLMLTGRWNPHAVVMKGKVYIMGGLPDHHSGPWAEVFDPISLKSFELPPPPFQPEEKYSICAALEDEERIVVACPFSTRILFFDAVPMTWRVFAEAVHKSIYIGGEDIVGVSGKTIYWYSMGWLYAYDFDPKLKFFGRIKRLKEQKEYLYDPEPLIRLRTHVFHLSGDLFCLLYLKSGDLHCNIFEVVKYIRGMKGHLRASVVSHKFKKFGDPDILFLKATLL